MPEPRPDHAALAERNRLLTQTRSITFGIAGGAALASLALGTAFAHALPGHSYHPSAAQAPVGARSSSPAAQSSRPAPQTARHGHSGRRHAARVGRAHRHVRHHQAIAPPTHAPAPAPSSSPPQVTSGGT